MTLRSRLASPPASLLLLLLGACASGPGGDPSLDAAVVGAPSGAPDAAIPGTPDGAPRPDPRPGFVDGPVGGARLRARVVEVAGGGEERLGWRDTALDVDCEFTEVGAAELRCLPEFTATATTTETFFADARCSIPAAALSAPFGWFEGCAVPGFARVQTVGAASCAAKPAYVRVGKPLAARTIYRLVGGACVPSAAPEPERSLGLHEVAPMDLSAFALGALEPGAARSGITPVYVVGADGARAFWTFRDAAGALDCALMPTDDGLRCLPSRFGVLGYEFGPGCTPAAMPLTCAAALGATLPVAYASPFPHGDKVGKIFQGGERLATTYFRDPSGACLPKVGGEAAFAVGPEIPASRFAAGARTREPLAEGLVQTVERAGGWSRPAGLASTAHGGHACAFAPAADGMLRCLPEPRFSAHQYSDPGCRARVALSDAPHLAVEERTSCPARIRVFARAGRHVGPVYERTERGCVVKMMAHAEGRTLFSAYPDEIPPASFPAGRPVLR
jgi:hypothetical protein